VRGEGRGTTWVVRIVERAAYLFYDPGGILPAKPAFGVRCVLAALSTRVDAPIRKQVSKTAPLGRGVKDESGVTRSLGAC